MPLLRLFPLLLLAAAALAGARPAAAQSEAALAAFDEGTAHYRAGDYAAAAAAFERAAETGWMSGALYYNLGNAYFRQDEIGQAVRYYEKARRLLPDNEELRHNLELARARSEDAFSRLPEPFWRPAWERMLAAVGAGVLFVLGLVLYLAGLSIVGWRTWTGGRGAWSRRLASALLVPGLLLLGLGLAASYDRRPGQEAVVVVPETALRDAPDATEPAALQLHEGTLLRILRTEADWLEVRLPNGTRGWIARGATAEV